MHMATFVEGVEEMKTSRYWVVLAAALIVAGCSSEDATAPPADTAEAADDSGSENARIDGSPEESERGAEDPTVETVSELPSVSTPTAEPPDVEDDTPGLAVGQKALDFELKDQNGETRTLAGILESGNAALVFYRSADW